MLSRTKAVKQFFDVPQTYLQKNVNITMRCLAVRELVEAPDGASILDIGCGDGRISLQYASATNTLVLVDLSDSMLMLARQNTPPAFQANVSYIHTDLHAQESLGQFDLVLCLGVLAHVDSVEQTVAKVAALLKPGGACIFQITDSQSVGGRLLNVLYKIRSMVNQTRAYALNNTRWNDLLSLARRNNLTFVDKRQYMMPFPGMGKLPEQWLHSYQMYTLRHKHIAKLSSEMICLFRKGNERMAMATTCCKQDA